MSVVQTIYQRVDILNLPQKNFLCISLVIYLFISCVYNGQQHLGNESMFMYTAHAQYFFALICANCFVFVALVSARSIYAFHHLEFFSI